jgi:uncharacterized protein (TIGR03545 family)
MTLKAPALFRKRFKQETFEKNIIKFLELPADKDFLRAAFELKDHFYTIKPIPDKKTQKRLAKLAKDIKTNKKLPVKVIPLFLCAAGVAAAIVFFAFANSILENLIERALENVFEARVDIDNFNIDFINFRLGMDRITIADRDSPMKNFIETGATRINVNSTAVLRGKAVIDEIRADSIQFGTARTISGALPQKEPPKKAESGPQIEIPPFVDLENFDAMALINREYDKLRSVRLYTEAQNFYTASAEKWPEQIDTVKRQYNELRSTASPLLAINVNSFNLRDPATLEKVRQLIEDTKNAVDAVHAAADTVNTVYDGVQSDLATFTTLTGSAAGAFSGDLDHLKSLVDIQGGGYRELLDPLIEQVLTGEAQKYIGYGRRGLEILEQVKAVNDKLPKKEEKARFKGRDVVFPARQYPRFQLGILASDFTLDDWNWAFDLRNITSDPEITGAPTTLALSLAETGGQKRNAAVKAAADFRASAPNRYTVRAEAANFPFALGSQFRAAGIGGFTGNTAFSVESAGNRDGSFSAGGAVSVRDGAVLDPGNMIVRAIDEAIQDVPALDLGFRFDHASAGANDFSLSTNIGDVVLAALKRTAEVYVKKALDALESALRDYIRSYVDESYLSAQEMDALFNLVKGDKAAFAVLQSSLDTKRAELENRLKDAATAAVDEAKAEAERKLDDAKKEAEQKAADAVKGALGGSLPFRF